MDTDKPTAPPPAYEVNNYCACFIDILGQRHALRNQGLRPIITSQEQMSEFTQEVLKTTIAPIFLLQLHARKLMDALRLRVDIPNRQAETPEQREHWEKMCSQKLCLQYWSDGLVAFANLGNKVDASVEINGAFELIGLAGCLCLKNLGCQWRNPLRGGIEIAWGVELRPGELYGPAIARSYELESEVAQYPRIVVGDRMIEFLSITADLPDKDNFSRYGSSLAQTCLKMLLRDTDGQWTIHYLGETFQKAVALHDYGGMYNDALKFILEEYDRFRTAGESKLAMRYFQLLSYFQRHPPNIPTNAAGETA